MQTTPPPRNLKKVKNLYKTIISSAFLTLVLTGCESVNSALETTNAVLGAANSVLGAATGTSTSSGGGYSGSPTASQQSQMSSAVAYKASNAQLKQAVAEANPVIKQFLSVASCQLGDGTGAMTGVARITASQTTGLRSSTREFTRLRKPNNHPQGKCLTVARVDSWEMIAKNAFEFSVLLVSDESGESLVRYMGMRKENGEWRVYKFQNSAGV